jgi:hypothetical protein
MFNLIANAMFEATRLPAPPDRPVRNRWFVRRAEDLALLPGRPSEPPRTVLAAGVGASRGTMP